MSEHDELVEKVARAIYGVHPHYDVDQGFVVMSWDDLVAFEEGAAYTPTVTIIRHKARAAIAAMGDGWQDIGSAPRDGTLCLFFAPGRNKAKYIERAKRQMTVVDAFSPQWVNGKYQLPENPYTHWRPLPKPPGSASND